MKCFKSKRIHLKIRHGESHTRTEYSHWAPQLTILEFRIWFSHWRSFAVSIGVKMCYISCIAYLCIRKFSINILLNDATNATFSHAPWQIIVHWMLAHYVYISFVLAFSAFNDINKWSSLKIRLIFNVRNHTMKLNWVIIRFSICFIYKTVNICDMHLYGTMS